MQFIQLHGELINVGTIVNIDFTPGTKENPEGPNWKRLGAGEMVDQGALEYMLYPRARVTVSYKDQPIEMISPEAIDFLNQLWNAKTIIASF